MEELEVLRGLHDALQACVDDDRALDAFFKHLQDWLADPGRFTPSQQLEFFETLRGLLLTSEGYARPVLVEHGWEVARLLGPYIAPPELDLEGNAEKVSDISKLLLRGIAAECHPRELAMFSLEYVSELRWDYAEDSSMLYHKMAVFMEFANVWVKAIGRIKPTRLSVFMQSALPTILRAVEVCDHLRSVTFPAETDKRISSMHDVLLRFYLDVLEELTRVVDEVRERADATEQERQRFLLAYFVFEICRGSVANLPLALMESKSRRAVSYWGDLHRLLATGRAIGLTLSTLLSAKCGNSKAVGVDLQWSSVGRSIFIVLAIVQYTLNEAAEKSAAECGDSPLFLERLNSEWLLTALQTDIQTLISRPEQVDAELADKALFALDVCIQRVPRESLNMTSFEASTNGTTLKELVLSCLTFMALTPHHQPRAKCFALFKELIWRLEEEARVSVLVQMLTDTPLVSVQIAALSILKDNVHECWNRYDPARPLDRVDHKPRYSLFAGPFLTETFLSVLLDPTSIPYRAIMSAHCNILNDDDAFFEKHGLVMHTLNLYLYTLIRDKPDINKTGLWTHAHLDSTMRRMIKPLQDRVIVLQKQVSRKLATVQDDNPGETKQEDLYSNSFSLDLMDDVLGRVVDRMNTGRAVLDDM
ncbi:uncharacterized protein SPPG_02459 [Spizellomyces punctatus DAOM BR117]|uniref:Uncharacterized protein n=1 Tax=Spizellomyces punctatus (strain DAOM BR117) TaxID=645134 RepID=A0A0L0HKF6_SPIPD|nr:uncharacterized protein SPPG_02459 [Spizellomyces punctatus DAOM BR117]KND01951.1 hypothetical protein SPPG_02459 [Spizellomyces punctatus DAOM BR117]|eukprot:XP_016609990.1 hypothetical protein SPPG_02459 [Spizellomyces punctatus DAOM BR117]